MISRRTRHISIKHACLNDWVQRELIAIKKVASADNVADIFTKPLGRILFRRLAQILFSSVSQMASDGGAKLFG